MTSAVIFTVLLVKYNSGRPSQKFKLVVVSIMFAVFYLLNILQINIKDEMWCERFQTQTQATPDHSTCTSLILRITNTAHHFDQERVTSHRCQF